MLLKRARLSQAHLDLDAGPHHIPLRVNARPSVVTFPEVMRRLSARALSPRQLAKTSQRRDI